MADRTLAGASSGRTDNMGILAEMLPLLGCRDPGLESWSDTGFGNIAQASCWPKRPPGRQPVSMTQVPWEASSALEHDTNPGLHDTRGLLIIVQIRAKRPC